MFSFGYFVLWTPPIRLRSTIQLAHWVSRLTPTLWLPFYRTKAFRSGFIELSPIINPADLARLISIVPGLKGSISTHRDVMGE